MFENMTKWTVGLLAVGCVLAMAATAGADFTTKNSADFDWKYEMGVLPDAENLNNNFNDPPANTDPIYDFHLTDNSGGGYSFAPTTDGDILTVDASHRFQNGSYRNEDNWRSDATISGANGWTFEVRARVTASRPLGFYFDAGSGTSDPFAGLGLLPDGQYWGYMGSPPALGPAVDNHTDFHVFRVAQAPGAATFSVWRDGMLLSDTLTSAFPGVHVDKIQFGDAGEDWGGGVLEVDYLRFIGGAWAPDDTPPPPIPGDANLDDVVNDADASILAAHWQQTGMGWGDGDFNGDTVVNDADASILAAHWQESQEGAAPVPEPSVLVLLFGVGLIGLLAHARRRR